MKKLLMSSVLACALGLTGLHAEGNSGAFLGINLGGMVNGSIGNGDPKLNSSLAAGLRIGYQSYFSERVGARFYLSGIAGFGLLAVNAGQGGTTNGMNVTLNVMGDLNGDLLFDFVNDGDFSTGMYLGFFGGALFSTPLYVPTGMTRNPNTVATTVGLNLGFRTTVREHHEFDFGVKFGAALNMEGTTTNIGAVGYLGSSYSYKF